MPRLGHRDEFLFHCISQLGQVIRRGDDLSVMMADRLQQLIRQHLYHRYQPGPNPQAAGSHASALPPQVARRISDFIESQLDQRITLAQLAAVADIGVNPLLVAFRRNFGTTPAQYILDQRLRRARWRLLNTLQDVGEIALACGFASHSHLSASFRRRSGVTPTEFRKGLRTLRPG